MTRTIPGPYDAAEMRRFLESFMYREEVFLVDEVLRLDVRAREIEARLDTQRYLPFASHQRVMKGHPAHVSGPELVMITADLGCLHAWFFHGCRWDEGWVGFGSRIHRADFRTLALVGPGMELFSRETQSRASPRRVVLRYEFEFRQQGRVVYAGDQSAMFVKDKADIWLEVGE